MTDGEDLGHPFLCKNCNRPARYGWVMCHECRGADAAGRAEIRRRIEAEVRQIEQEQRERDRLDAERREAQRQEELELIAEARLVAADRKHQADLAWAKRVLADDVQPASDRGSIARSVRHAVWQRDGGRCHECGSNESLEFDHIIPVAMGGANTERNLQLLCQACNRRKGKSLG